MKNRKPFSPIDPESSFSLLVKFKQEMESENLEEAENIMLRFRELFGEVLTTQGQKIQLLNKREKYQEAIDLIEKLYAQNPHVWEFVKAKYEIESKVKKDQKSAFKVYETYLKEDFECLAALTLAGQYLSNGKPEEAVELYEKIHKNYPMNLEAIRSLLEFYFNNKQYDAAQIWADKLSAMAPNSDTYLAFAARLALQKGEEKRALNLYVTALQHGPNNFELST